MSVVPSAITNPPAAVSPYLNLPALAAVSHLRFSTRHRIEGSYSGRHRSRQRGGSAEFVDYRQYSAGEDLRRVDWKVLGRTGRSYVRLYQDETNLRCTLLLDASASMGFSGVSQNIGDSKLRYTQHLATAISHVIGTQRDQVGLAIAGNGIINQLPVAGTPSHIRQLQQIIQQLDTGPLPKKTDLTLALRQLFDRSNHRGVVLIMSDFLVDDPQSLFAAVRLFRHRRWEVVILHIIHPQEEHLPIGAAYRFQGMENDGQTDCSPVEIAAAYEKSFESHAAAIRAAALAAGCDYRRISTAVPYMQTLSGFLIERAG